MNKNIFLTILMIILFSFSMFAQNKKKDRDYTCATPVIIEYPIVTSDIGFDIVAEDNAGKGGLSAGGGSACIKPGDPALYGSYRHLRDKNDFITFSFSVPVKSVDVWLLLMGNNEYGNWYPEDSAHFILPEVDDFTIEFAQTDCKNNTVINNTAKTVTVNSVWALDSYGNINPDKNNLTNIRLKISSDEYFTELTILNPENRATKSDGTPVDNDKLGYGFYVELCLESVDTSGLDIPEDKDADNDGISNVDEGYPCSYEEGNYTMIAPSEKVEVSSSHGVYHATRAVDSNEANGTYAALNADDDYIIFDLGVIATPADIVDFFMLNNKVKKLYVSESLFADKNFSEEREVSFFSYKLGLKWQRGSFHLKKHSRYIKIRRIPGSHDAYVDYVGHRLLHYCESAIDTDGDGIPDFLDTDCENGSAANFVLTGTANTDITYTITKGGVESGNQTISLGATGSASLSASNTQTSTITLKSIKYSSGVDCEHSITGNATVTVNPAPTPKVYYIKE